MKRNRLTAVLTFAVCLIVILSMALSACRKQPSSGDNTAEPAVDNNTPIPTVEITPEATDEVTDTIVPAVTMEIIPNHTEDPDNTGVIITIPTDQGSGGL